jgi:hypothetical protein
MAYLRRVGIYLVCVCSALLLSSFWQLRYGSGHADLSFLLVVPFAIGLFRARAWALWGTAIIGGIVSAGVIGTAIIQSTSGLPGLTLWIGPVTLTEPSALLVWLFAISFVIVLGVPMLSVLTRRGELNPQID